MEYCTAIGRQPERDSFLADRGSDETRRSVAQNFFLPLFPFLSLFINQLFATVASSRPFAQPRPVRKGQREAVSRDECSATPSAPKPRREAKMARQGGRVMPTRACA